VHYFVWEDARDETVDAAATYIVFNYRGKLELKKRCLRDKMDFKIHKYNTL